MSMIITCGIVATDGSFTFTISTASANVVVGTITFVIFVIER